MSAPVVHHSSLWDALKQTYDDTVEDDAYVLQEGTEEEVRDNEEDWEKGIPPFVKKLTKMVGENKNTFNWTLEGSFIVIDVDGFSNVVLPKYFKNIKFCSFIRQLNMYGFHKVDDPTGTDMKHFEFKNPNFIPGRKELLKRIERRKAVKRTTRKDEDPGAKQATTASSRSRSQSAASAPVEYKPPVAPEPSSNDGSFKTVLDTVVKLQQQAEINQLALKQVLDELTFYRKSHFELEHKLNQHISHAALANSNSNNGFSSMPNSPQIPLSPGHSPVPSPQQQQPGTPPIHQQQQMPRQQAQHRPIQQLPRQQHQQQMQQPQQQMQQNRHPQQQQQQQYVQQQQYNQQPQYVQQQSPQYSQQPQQQQSQQPQYNQQPQYKQHQQNLDQYSPQQQFSPQQYSPQQQYQQQYTPPQHSQQYQSQHQSQAPNGTQQQQHSTTHQQQQQQQQQQPQQYNLPLGASLAEATAAQNANFYDSAIQNALQADHASGDSITKLLSFNGVAQTDDDDTHHLTNQQMNKGKYFADNPNLHSNSNASFTTHVGEWKSAENLSMQSMQRQIGELDQQKLLNNFDNVLLTM